MLIVLWNYLPMFLNCFLVASTVLNDACSSLAVVSHITGGGPGKIIYPRQCDICHRTYSKQSSFSRHLKDCKRVLAYPSQCDLCSNSYLTEDEFLSHDQLCRIAKDLNVQNVVKLKAIGFKTKPSKYPKQCKFCQKEYKTQPSYSRHVKSCTNAIKTISCPVPQSDLKISHRKK